MAKGTNGNRRRFLKVTGGTLAGSSLLAGCSGKTKNESETGGSSGGTTTSSGPDFPSKEIRWVIPYSPGGGFDTYSRAIANRMPKYLPNSVNIYADNVTGAGGRRGATENYNAKPDGHTIGIWNMPGMVVAQTIKETNYDTTKVSWLGRVVQEPYLMLVSEKGPFSSVEDVVNYGDTIKVAATGPGSTAFLVSVIALSELGVDFKFVTGFKGSQEQAAAVLRGEVDLFHTSMGSSTAKSFVDGDGKALMYYGSKDSMPGYLPSDVPTAKEAGYPSVQGILANHRLVGGPPGIPSERREILEDAFLKTLNSDKFAEWAEGAGRPVGPVIDGEQTQKVVKRMKDTFDKYNDVLKEYMT